MGYSYGKPRKYMSYSKAHQRFSDDNALPEALINPQDFLGPNYETILNFWWYIETLTEEQMFTAHTRYCSIPDAETDSSYFFAADVADYVTVYSGRIACQSFYIFNSSIGPLAYDVTYELITMHVILKEGKSLMFIPLFDKL